MPIHRDSYPEDIDLKPGTTKSDIVVFLYSNLELAYTPTEIADELNIPTGTASTTLRRLHEDDLVGRIENGYYHGLTGRTDLRRYPESVSQTVTMFDTHPDSADAPDPDSSRPGDAEAIDEDLEHELQSLDADVDR